MTTPTMDQTALDNRQRELNAQRFAAQQKAAQEQHDLGKAVQELLKGVPMHGTNVSETAMVCLAVIALREKANGPHHAAGPANPAGFHPAKG